MLLAALHSALALTMAHGRGDLLAVEHGRIDVEPYQLVPALAGLRQPRVRLLVADDVGLGKTIEAGLILLELARRGRANRVLIACPAGLQDQWVEEMRFRFNLDFTKVDSRQWLELRRNYPSTVSPWTAAPYAVSSIDYLKGNVAAIQAAPKFDLVIIDEAHHVARVIRGGGPFAATDRSRLARVLADHCAGADPAVGHPAQRLLGVVRQPAAAAVPAPGRRRRPPGPGPGEALRGAAVEG